MYKKVIAIMVAVVISCIGSAGIAYADTAIFASFYNDTPIYADKNTESSVIKTLAQNEQVAVIESVVAGDKTFYKVNTDKGVGYILSTALYHYRAPSTYNVIMGKATAEKIGLQIFLYDSPNIENTPYTTITDGTNLDIIESVGENFYKIRYQDKILYIQSTNVSTGMSYYQQMALIIGLISLVTVVLILLLLYYNKNKKRI